ncbi:hypothetical protein L1987_64950 [Smallanthus sonchifolius]|uniref:Uncharacterized protein n=1 Tax=Smallanthus sonchifolius TaxID=185202 RepID=A0ACB9BT56_9ASTR|nr:hypothetical protein L1987_64950 [Smallanthus sonchifolius]
MRIATKLFKSDQILGEGGFGIVYKGVIDENVRIGYSKIHVAIKELDPEGIQGDREWLIALDAAKGLALLHDAERPLSIEILKHQIFC